jgi:nucleoside-diphosphate-sugar epimerase
LVEKVAEKVHYNKNNVVFCSYPPGYPLRPITSDQPYIILDSSKAKKEIDWNPRVDLNEGLQRVIEYWRENLGARTKNHTLL